MGIDPGTAVMGWGVVERQGARLTCVASGELRPRGTRAERLAAIVADLRRLLARWTPHVVSLEQSFVGSNVQSAFRIGEARGAALVAAAQAAVPVVEYAPARIKKAVAGDGRASKEQIQRMVGRLLGVGGKLAADEADALAAAICHAHSAPLAMLARRTRRWPGTPHRAVRQLRAAAAGRRGRNASR